MTEKQFLQHLEQAMDRLPVEERNDILQDIREYFASGHADGKTDNEIAEELGNPANIAKELVDNYDFNQIEIPALNIDLAKDEFDKVEIEIDNGHLHITPSKDGQLHVDVTEKNYKQQLEVEIVNRTLMVSLTEEVKIWKIFSITRSMNTPTLTLQLPDKLYKLIEITSEHGSITGERLAGTEFEMETENGSIDFSQIGAGTFSANSDNGDIRLTSIQTKNLEVETENGRLILQDIQSGKVQVTSDNGAIHLKKVEGEISAQTDNGRIHLLTDHLERNVHLETDNGAILIETKTQPKNTSIRAEVDWGTVSVFGSKNRKTVFGNGQHLINLQSDNGSVTVKLAE